MDFSEFDSQLAAGLEDAKARLMNLGTLRHNLDKDRNGITAEMAQARKDIREFDKRMGNVKSRGDSASQPPSA